MMGYKVGDTIRINYMADDMDYCDREGVICKIDDAGQLHGTWGWLAVIPDVDDFIVIKKC